MRIRRASAADIPVIMALERRISDSAHWSPREYEQIFYEQISQTSGHEQPKRVAWIAEADSPTRREDLTESTAVAGFLVAHEIGSEWELENLGVAPEARRQGIAGRLLSEFIAHARHEHGSAIILEVRESNGAARALYIKFGFVETGVRRGYYSDPPESAILCELRV